MSAPLGCWVAFSGVNLPLDSGDVVVGPSVLVTGANMEVGSLQM